MTRSSKHRGWRGLRKLEQFFNKASCHSQDGSAARHTRRQSRQNSRSPSERSLAGSTHTESSQPKRLAHTSHASSLQFGSLVSQRAQRASHSEADRREEDILDSLPASDHSASESTRKAMLMWLKRDMQADLTNKLSKLNTQLEALEERTDHLDRENGGICNNC